MASDMTSRQLYIRLLTYVRPYWKALVVAMVATGLSSLAEPVLPAMMKRILDDGFSSAAGPWDWLIYPLAIMGVFLLRASFGFIGEYLMSWVSNNVVTELRQAMFSRMIRLPTRYYSDNLSGRLMSRIAYDVQGVAGAATNALTSLIRDTLSIIGLMSWLLYLNWKLTLITLSVVPFIASSASVCAMLPRASRSRWVKSAKFCRRPSRVTRWSRFSVARATRKSAFENLRKNSAGLPCVQPWPVRHKARSFSSSPPRAWRSSWVSPSSKRPMTKPRSAALFRSLPRC